MANVEIMSKFVEIIFKTVEINRVTVEINGINVEIKPLFVEINVKEAEIQGNQNIYDCLVGPLKQRSFTNTGLPLLEKGIMLI